MSDLLDDIDDAIRSQKCIALARTYYDVAGIPLSRSNNWVLMYALNDFQFDGYRMVPVCQCRRVRAKGALRSIQYILGKEGKLQDVGVPFKIDLRSARTILAGLRKQDRLVTIECEVEDGDHCVYLGKIAALDDRSLVLAGIDPDRYWYEKPYRIPFERITQIVVDLEYATLFEKYARVKPKRKPAKAKRSVKKSR